MVYDPFLGQRFTANGNDGGIYYVAQRDATDTLWWFGEDREADWAHVFRGRITMEGGDARWEGVFIDVPKGRTCGHGSLRWERHFTRGIPFLQRTFAEGLFGGTILAPGHVAPGSVTRLPPGFSGENPERNLTGVWQGSDGGTYYLREVGETGRVAWVGEHPEAEPGTDEVTGSRWVNVFMGQRVDLRGEPTGPERPFIQGEWSDVPKGEVNRFGTMRMVVRSSGRRIDILSKTGGFGGVWFLRLDDVEVTLRWVSLTVVDQQEWFFEADEPYFLAIIALMDGRTVNLNDPSRSFANFEHSFVAPTLRSNVGAGTVIDLSSLPETRVGIRPVPGDRRELEHPVFAIAVRGAEQDESSRQWREDRLQNWIEAGGGHVSHQLRATGRAGFERNILRWHSTWTWRNEDDLLGVDTHTFSYARLLGMAGRSERIAFDLRGRDVRYSVAADLVVRGVRGACVP